MQTETRAPRHTNAARGVWAERGHRVPAHHPWGGLKVAGAHCRGDLLTAVQRPLRQMPRKKTRTKPVCSLFPMCPQTCSLSSLMLRWGDPGYYSPRVSRSPQRGAEESHGCYSSCLTPRHTPLPLGCPRPAQAGEAHRTPVGIQPCCFFGPALCNCSLRYFHVKTLWLHLHPARILSDTAKNTEVIHKRKKETQSQNQMKPFNDAMNQRNANENMMAYQISKDKKGNTHCWQRFEKTHTALRVGIRKGVIFRGAIFQKASKFIENKLAL